MGEEKRSKDKDTESPIFVDGVTKASKAIDRLEDHVKYAKEIKEQWGKTGLPKVAGRISEDYLAATFDADAITKGLSPRATTTARINLPHAPSDVNVVSKGKLVQEVQAKFTKNAAATAREISSPKYKGMQKVVPADQLDEVRRIANKAASKPLTAAAKSNYADTAKNVSKEISYGGAKGKGLTRPEAIKHAKNPKKLINTQIEQTMLSSVGNATMLGAGMSAAVSSVSNIKKVIDGKMDGGEAAFEIIKDVGKGALDSGAKTAVGIGLARTGAAMFKGNVAVGVATVAVDGVKDFCNYLDGDIDGEEFTKRTCKNAVKTGGAMACAELFAAAGTFVCPGAGTIIGGVVGGALGFMGIGKLFD